MKKLATFSIVALTALPGIVAAQDLSNLGSFIEKTIQSAQSGNGTVIIENSSSVSTGGQTAGSGQTATTGDSSASSRIETRINSNDSRGTVDVRIETRENGTTKVEEYSKSVEGGVRVDVRASSQNGTSTTDVRFDGEDVQPSSTSSSTPTRIEAKIKTLFSIKLPELFKKVFSFISWF